MPFVVFVIGSAAELYDTRERAMHQVAMLRLCGAYGGGYLYSFKAVNDSDVAALLAHGVIDMRPKGPASQPPAPSIQAPPMSA